MRQQQRSAAVLAFGLVNLALGLFGFFGPFVTGNEEGLINVETGQLFGLVAINWAHALVFLAFGLYGVAAHRSNDKGATYFLSVAVVFGLLTVLGLLAHIDWLRVADPEGTAVVYEIAVDPAATVLHLLWMIVGLFYGRRARNTMEHQHEHQPRILEAS